MKNDRIKGLTGFCQRWLYLGKGGCIWAKVVVFGQNGCIWANWLYFGKMVVIGQIRSIWAKVALFGQRWFYLGKSGCIWAKWFYLGKLVLFGQKWFYFCKGGCIAQTWLYLRKMIVFGQIGSIWANSFYLGSFSIPPRLGRIGLIIDCPTRQQLAVLALQKSSWNDCRNRYCKSFVPHSAEPKDCWIQKSFFLTFLLVLVGK